MYFYLSVLSDWIRNAVLKVGIGRPVSQHIKVGNCNLMAHISYVTWGQKRSTLLVSIKSWIFPH